MKRRDGRPRADKGTRRPGYHQRGKTLVDLDAEAERLQVFQLKRRRSCPRCGATLNSYNQGTLCGPCMCGLRPLGSA